MNNGRVLQFFKCSIFQSIISEGSAFSLASPFLSLFFLRMSEQRKKAPYVQGNSKDAGPVWGQFLHQNVSVDFGTAMCKTAGRIPAFPQ